MSKNALIVFQKNAIPGKVKTRLAAGVGDQQAMKIYHWLTSKTFQSLSQVAVDAFVFYSDFVPNEPNEESKDGQQLVQNGANLGDRMRNAFELIFAKGYSKVVIIGTDCPEISPEILNEAFESLETVNLVLGPAKDGGYYLLGTNQHFPQLFDDIPWSTDQVLDLTKKKAEGLHLSFYCLKTLSDIDTLEDWEDFIKRNPLVFE